MGPMARAGMLPTMRSEPVSLRHLRRLCFDVVQRSPTAAELRNLTGAEPGPVVERLVRSREAMSAWFEEAWSQTPNGRGALTEPGARLRYDDATARNRSRANA